MSNLEEDLFFILDSSIRVIIIKELNKPKSCSTIATKFRRNRSVISREMQKLKEKEIVKLSNKVINKNHFYSLTNYGKEIEIKIKNEFF